MKLLSVLLALALALALAGCAGISGKPALTQDPEFDLFEFFDGRVLATGIVQNRSGEVIQRFDALIDGIVEGDTLVLDESFTYFQGEGPATRVWTIERAGSGYIGSATDIPGPAVGRSFGNALNWRYVMDLPVGDRTVKVAFDDWFWALDGERIINRSYISKFGIRLAEVTLYMERVEQ